MGNARREAHEVVHKGFTQATNLCWITTLFLLLVWRVSCCWNWYSPLVLWCPFPRSLNVLHWIFPRSPNQVNWQYRCNILCPLRSCLLVSSTPLLFFGLVLVISFLLCFSLFLFLLLFISFEPHSHLFLHFFIHSFIQSALSFSQLAHSLSHSLVSSIKSSCCISFTPIALGTATVGVFPPTYSSCPY